MVNVFRVNAKYSACFILFVATFSVIASEDSRLSKRLEMLGGTFPKNEPKVFSANTISMEGRNEFGISISRKFDAFYFGVDVGHRTMIYEIKFQEAGWGRQKILLSDEKLSFNDPMLSANEKRLYFMTNMESEDKDFNIGYLRKEKSGWTLPVIDKRISTPHIEYFYSESKRKEAFFSREIQRQDKRDFDIFSYLEGRNEKELKLSSNVNSTYYDGDPFVTQDGHYMVFASTRPGSKGRGDLYVSKRINGKWDKAKPLPESINTEEHELTPFITADGKWLFFSRAGDIYWVSSDVVFSLP